MSDDLDGLIRDLGEFPKNAGGFIESALKITAHKMKDSWRDLAKSPSGRHASAYPTSVDYDITKRAFPSFEAEIGPSLGRRQGALGILEESNGGVRAAPQNVRPQVVEANESDFERGMDKAAEDALRRVGL